MADHDDSDLKTKVLKEAENLYQQNWKPGKKDHCAKFVRHCFENVGYPLLETKNPSDLALCLKHGDTLGATYANSLAGDEIGRKLPMDQAQPGDLIFFNNVGNFDSDYLQGTIVHVGICIGDHTCIDHEDHCMHKGPFADYAGPGRWAEARRPKLFDIPRTRIQLEKGKLTQTLRNTKAYGLDVLVNLSTSGVTGLLKQEAGKMHLPGGGGLEVFVNDAKVPHYKACLLYTSRCV